MKRAAWNIMFAWWILVKFYNGGLDIPSAAGPYPSRALCMTAGKGIVPKDQRFWSKDEIAKAEVERIREEAIWAAKQLEIDAKKAKLKGRGGVIKIDECYEITVDKNGDEMFTTTGCINIASVTSATALSGCVEVPE